MRVYYNEFDKKKCAALKALMDDGFISRGDIDDRSIKDVRGSDLEGYTRCHFFAGVGLWDYALQLARWPDNRPVWTGSCPCQPFSIAGKQRAKSDERHLWPIWYDLIKERNPNAIFGEQVEKSITHGWLDEVGNDLEKWGYAFGSVVLPACSINTPHKRDRIYFVADATCEGGRWRDQMDGAPEKEPRRSGEDLRHGFWPDHAGSGSIISVPDICVPSYGYSERVGLIHAAGDAIVPQLAAEFIGAYMETFQ